VAFNVATRAKACSKSGQHPASVDQIFANHPDPDRRTYKHAVSVLQDVFAQQGYLTEQDMDKLNIPMCSAKNAAVA
jgi:hypothetical protein